MRGAPPRSVGIASRSRELLAQSARECWACSCKDRRSPSFPAAGNSEYLSGTGAR